MTDEERTPFDPRDDVDEISLRGLRFHVRVGILPHEQQFAQPLEIDVTVWKRPGGDVVDYRVLFDLAKHAVSGELKFLEDIGEEIAQGALRQPAVQRVRVAVRKPHVPLPGPLDHSEVVVVRNRHG